MELTLRSGSDALDAEVVGLDLLRPLDYADYNALLEELFAHYFKDQLVYRHGWRVGDIVFWDNRCLAHIAHQTCLDDPGYIRRLHRTSIQEGAPANAGPAFHQSHILR